MKLSTIVVLCAALVLVDAAASVPRQRGHGHVYPGPDHDSFRPATHGRLLPLSDDEIMAQIYLVKGTISVFAIDLKVVWKLVTKCTNQQEFF